MWEGMAQGMWIGISTTMIPINIAMVLLGCFGGSFIGMLPGLGPITAVALMIPVTYGMDPATGMVLLAGLYYGAIFGGSPPHNAKGEVWRAGQLQTHKNECAFADALSRPLH